MSRGDPPTVSGQLFALTDEGGIAVSSRLVRRCGASARRWRLAHAWSAASVRNKLSPEMNFRRRRRRRRVTRVAFRQVADPRHFRPTHTRNLFQFVVDLFCDNL